jgi:hypothetical protein
MPSGATLPVVAYKLFGMVVWKLAKWLVRGRYGSLRAPRSVLAGGLVLVIVGVVLAARGRCGGD